MKIHRKALITKIKVRSKNGGISSGNFGMIGHFYGDFSQYTLKEFYTKYIKALYEN